jgi:hypothetical protein
MKKLSILFATAIFFISAAYSQTEFGADYRYSGGGSFSQHSIGGSVENFSGKNSWIIGINYNFSNFGEGKEANSGSGLGIFAGYRYGFSYGSSGNLFGGADFSFVFNKNHQGKSYTVLSPSLEFGYHHTFNHFGKGAFASPAVGIGYNFELGQKEEYFEEAAFFRARTTIGYRF